MDAEQSAGKTDNISEGLVLAREYHRIGDLAAFGTYPDHMQMVFLFCTKIRVIEDGAVSGCCSRVKR